jgi:hypothetical protein
VPLFVTIGNDIYLVLRKNQMPIAIQFAAAPDNVNVVAVVADMYDTVVLFPPNMTTGGFVKATGNVTVPAAEDPVWIWTPVETAKLVVPAVDQFEAAAP